MRTASTAEWILCRVTTKERAASMVGDLVEIEKQKGLLWFWLSIARIALSLYWRRPLAFVAAVYAQLWIFNRFSVEIWGIDSPHRMAYSTSFCRAINGAGIILWIVLSYAAIRYGFRDRLTQLAMGLTGVVTLFIYFWWLPVAAAICAVLFGLIVVVSVLNRDRRNAAMVLLVTVPVGLAGGLLVMFLGSACPLIFYLIPKGDGRLQEFIYVYYMAFLVFFMTPWVTTAACSRMHNWMIRSQSLESRRTML
jgi:hypothetical protein